MEKSNLSIIWGFGIRSYEKTFRKTETQMTKRSNIVKQNLQLQICLRMFDLLIQPGSKGLRNSFFCKSGHSVETMRSV